jgi:hypothetical protein
MEDNVLPIKLVPVINESIKNKKNYIINILILINVF